MKKLGVLIALTVCSSATLGANIYWIANAASNWNLTSNWSYASGGTTCGCIPTITDVVIFDGASGGNGNGILDMSPSIGALQLTGFSGTIDLNGFNLTTGASTTINNIFNTGSFSGSGTLIVTSTRSASFGGTDFTGTSTNVMLTLTTTTGVYTGFSGSIFSGTVNVTAYSILLNGSTYQNTATFTKTGNVADTGTGGNTFDGATTIVNDADASLISANVNPDIFNGTLSLNITGSNANNKLRLAYTAANNQFNGDIRVQSLNSLVANAEISFGANGGTSVLANGVTIEEESAANQFLKGDLWLNNISQSIGTTTAQTLNLQLVSASSSAMRLKISNCTFYGNVTFTASNFYVSNSNFFGDNNILTKSLGGASDSSFPPPSLLNTWAGGNTFNSSAGGTTTINNMHNSTLVMGGTNGDTFNGHVIFYSDQSSSNFRIADAGTTYIKGNITFIVDAAGPASVRFGVAGGITEINGTAKQFINSSNITSVSNPSIPDFYSLTMNNVYGLELNRRIQITTTLTLSAGTINASAANYIEFKDNATATVNANNLSYIDGVVRKVGDDEFTFPTGGAGFYRPITISAPVMNTSVFVATYYNANHGLGTTADVPLEKVSTCEYWTLSQAVGAETINVTLSWDEDTFCYNENYITSPSNLRVVQWSGTSWTDRGSLAWTGTATSGNVTSLDALSTFGTFTLGSVTASNELPIELIQISAHVFGNSVHFNWVTASEHNNSFFSIERLEQREGRFIELTKVAGSGTTMKKQTYSWIDSSPIAGRSYYRLKQTDFDNTTSYSKPMYVFFDGLEKTGEPFPNPVKNEMILESISMDQPCILEIMSVEGVILHVGEFVPRYDVSRLPAGFYTVRLRSTSQIKQFKIIKQ
jgi:hypothetical protein